MLWRTYLVLIFAFCFSTSVSAQNKVNKIHQLQILNTFDIQKSPSNGGFSHSNKINYGLNLGKVLTVNANIGYANYTRDFGITEVFNFRGLSWGNSVALGYPFGKFYPFIDFEFNVLHDEGTIYNNKDRGFAKVKYNRLDAFNYGFGVGVRLAIKSNFLACFKFSHFRYDTYNRYVYPGGSSVNKIWAKRAVLTVGIGYQFGDINFNDSSPILERNHQISVEYFPFLAPRLEHLGTSFSTQFVYQYQLAKLFSINGKLGYLKYSTIATERKWTRNKGTLLGLSMVFGYPVKQLYPFFEAGCNFLIAGTETKYYNNISLLVDDKANLYFINLNAGLKYKLKKSIVIQLRVGYARFSLSKLFEISGNSIQKHTSHRPYFGIGFGYQFKTRTDKVMKRNRANTKKTD